MTSVRKDPFGKSDEWRHLCSKHAPPWSFFGSAARERDAAADRIRALEAALRKIVRDGDYTAPEGMKRIAQEALGSELETAGEPSV